MKRARPQGKQAKPKRTADAQAEWNAIQQSRKLLPVFAQRKEIVGAIVQSRVVILVGETGSGKTTQLPQFLLEERNILGSKQAIAVTQPRRVAAVSIATRVAAERACGGEVGHEVGYTIRFDDCTRKQTRLKYVTDGMLLREAMVDRSLLKYGMIILDEAHERTCNTDLLFGVVKDALRRRSDLRVVVMSATLDVELFRKFFSTVSPGSNTLTKCPPPPRVIRVKGRQHPVQILYAQDVQTDYIDACVVAVLQLHLEQPEGDVLVFLTGQEEIETCSEMLEQKANRLNAQARVDALDNSSSTDASSSRPLQPSKLLICPLFAAQPSAKQMQVFAPTPPGFRKVIISTNIAETSITVSGVRYVIDAGLVKTRKFKAKEGFESLEVVPVSKAQAVQRSGRAGREAPGRCFRLYREIDFEDLSETPVPEIRRVGLSEIVLQLYAMGVEDAFKFDFLERPATSSLRAAHVHLLALGALSNESRTLSPLGKQMSQMPLEPSLARLVLTAGSYGVTSQILSIVAMLSVDSPFFTPRGKREESGTAHKTFKSFHGDHLTLLNVYKAFIESGESKEWCTGHFLKPAVLSKARKVRNQLSDLLNKANDKNTGSNSLSESGSAANSHGSGGVGVDESTVEVTDEPEAVLRVLASAFFLQTAQRSNKNGDQRRGNKRGSGGAGGKQEREAPYALTANGIGVNLHPSSSLFNRQPLPDWVVYHEVVRSSKMYLRGVSAVPKDLLLKEAPQFYKSKSMVDEGVKRKEEQEQLVKRRRRAALMCG